MDCTYPADFGRSLPDDPALLGEGMKLEMGICSDYGEAWKLAWVPRGGCEEKVSSSELVDRDCLIGLVCRALEKERSSVLES